MSYEQCSDAELERRYCDEGDVNAFDALKGRYSRLVRVILGRILWAAPQEIDDVEQLVWIDVAAKMCGRNRAAPFVKWLGRVAHNKANSLLRKLIPAQRVQVPYDPTQLTAIVGEDSPEYDAERRAMVEAIRDCIERVKPEWYRQLAALVLLRGHTIGEAAGVLGVPLGTAKAAQFRALAQIRLCFKSKGWMQPDA